jgi:hypothetical protein
VTIRQGAGICECGDPEAVRRSSFCPEHRGGAPTMRESAPFTSVIRVVVDFAAEAFPARPALDCLRWLSGFAEWGDGFQRLLVDLLVPDALGAIARRAIGASPDARGCAKCFLVALICDVRLKQWAADFLLSLVPELSEMIKTAIPNRPDRIVPYEEFFELVYRVFVNRDVASAIAAGGDAIEAILAPAMRCLALLCGLKSRHDLLRFLDVVTRIIGIVSRIMEIPAVARDIVYSAKRSALISFFADLSGLVTIRRIPDGPRVEYDTFETMRAYCIPPCVRRLASGMVYGMKLLAADDCWERDLPVSVELSEAQRPRLFEFLADVRDACVSWDLAHDVGDMSSLSGEWSILLELTNFFFQVASSVVAYFRIPPVELFRSLEIQSLIPFVKRTLVTVAATSYCWTGAFVRNSRDVRRACRIIASKSDPLGRFSRWFYHFGLCLLIESQPGKFVEMAIDAFGCRKWLDSNGEDGEPNVDAWLPPTLLCRFFIQLMSDYTPPDRWDKRDVLLKSVMHELKLGPMSTADLKTNAFTSELSQIWLDALHHAGDPLLVDGERKYKLKQEFENSVSPFWILYSIPEFLGQVAIDPKSPSLVTLPNLDVQNGHLVDRFISSDQFVDFVARSVEIAVSHQDYGPVLLHCLLALVNMTVQATQLVGTTDPIEVLVAASVFDNFAKVSELHSPVLSLMSQIRSQVPSVADVLQKNVDAIEAMRPPPKPRRRPDHQRILRHFAEERERFAQSSAEDIESVEEIAADYVCVACREAINVEHDIFGIVWSGKSIHLCPHFGHRECFQHGVCPLCQVSAGLFTPVLLPKFDEAQRQAVGRTVDFFIENEFAIVVEQMGQLLDFEESAELPPLFVQLMQAIMLGASDYDAERLAHDPLLLFASLLPLSKEQYHFDWLVNALWKTTPCPMKSAVILWNCMALWSNSLESIDLAQFRAPEPSFYLWRLPERFVDLFLKDGGGDDLLRFKDGSAVCRCLKCGECLTVADENRRSVHGLIGHAVRCKLGLFLGLTGELATNVFRICRTAHTQSTGRTIRPMYVTEEGDEDVGLKLGVHLVISHERKRILQREILTGIYFTEPARGLAASRASSV